MRHSIHLTLVNNSNDENHSRIVIFQQNTIAVLGENPPRYGSTIRSSYS